MRRITQARPLGQGRVSDTYAMQCGGKPTRTQATAARMLPELSAALDAASDVAACKLVLREMLALVGLIAGAAEDAAHVYYDEPGR